MSEQRSWFGAGTRWVDSAVFAGGETATLGDTAVLEAVAARTKLVMTRKSTFVSRGSDSAVSTKQVRS